MSILAHSYQFVVGVDAHARNHALAIIACPNGELVDESQFPATPAGLARAVAWVTRRTATDVAGILWVVEGVGTYGARIAATAADGGCRVVEAARMALRANRGVGKSDPLDARGSLRPSWGSTTGGSGAHAATTAPAKHRGYVQKRTVEGRTPREIIRILKRYVPREVYRQLNAAAHPLTITAA